MRAHTPIRSMAAAGAVLLLSGAAQAVTIDWVAVGNRGNAPDRTGFGAVGGNYRIGTYEVTNNQYREFLNAVDADGTNPNDLYHTDMGADLRGGIAFDAAAASGSKYSARANMGNKPVMFVSFFDAMRFVNWLENGQPTDGSGTQSGVYSISDGLSETRAPGATYFIPREDEWYKAAFFDPRTSAQGGPPGDDNYWRYPTKSDITPVTATADTIGDISNPGTNVANFKERADWNGQDGNVTTVGTAGAASASFYGTFDQGGNVWEWNEAVIGVSERGMRGGSWADDGPGGMAAAGRGRGTPASASNLIGFRVARIPEPGTAALAMVGMLGLLGIWGQARFGVSP